MNDKHKPRAFLSSTFDDLEDHRAFAIDVLRKSGFTVDPMEDWTADPAEPKVFSQERIEGNDLLILLVALRRGHIPDGETQSITQLEYRYAMEHGIDVLAFMLEENAPWPGSFDERVEHPSLDSAMEPSIWPWRAWLKEHHGVGLFTTGPQTIQIAPALTRWVTSRREAAMPEIKYWLGRPASRKEEFVGRKSEIEAVREALDGV